MENKKEETEQPQQTENKEVFNPNSFTQSENKPIDYDKIVKEFGLKMLEQKHLDQIEKLSGKKPHHFFRRGIFFCHRDFDAFLNHLEKGG